MHKEALFKITITRYLMFHLMIKILVVSMSIILFTAFTGLKNTDNRSTTSSSIDEHGITTTAAPGADSSSVSAYTHEQQYLFTIVKSRRSVRRFRPTPIPEEDILTMLDMARSAPTSGNQQPWKFLVIRDREKLQRLKDASLDAVIQNARMHGNTDPVSLDSLRRRRSRFFSNYLSAPLCIIVLTDSNSTYPSYNVYDGTLAAENLMIAARALGYGSVFTTDSFPLEIIREVFEIPDNFKQICFMPIGIPEEWPESPQKKPLKDFIVFEKFAEGVNYTLPPKRTAIHLDPKSIDLIVGRYDLGTGTIITISRENDHALIQIPGQEKYEMFAETDTKFFLKAINAQIHFTKDKKGMVTGLTVFQGDGQFPAKKIE